MSEQKKTESQFVDFEIAKMLKKLGFDKHCLSYYSNYNQQVNRNDNWCLGFEAKDLTEDFMECLAPLWQQTEEWLWEKHKLSFDVSFHKGFYFECWKGRKYIPHKLGMTNEEIKKKKLFNNPIIAKIEGIKQAIKHLHSKK